MLLNGNEKYFVKTKVQWTMDSFATVNHDHL